MKKYLALTSMHLILVVLLFSCQKENVPDTEKTSEPSSESSRKPDNPGFADNDMVMFWNEKTTTALSAPMNQPRRARLFAITQIAVHDALNAIKPKFQRYALENTREQFANPAS